MKNIHAYAAEFLGTLLLALLVHLGVGGTLPVATPVIAGLTLGLIVYMFGSTSGAHVNPAVTLGMLSIKKIKFQDATFYWIAQFLGGFAAYHIGQALLGSTGLAIVVTDSLVIAAAEAMGAAILVLGVSSVVHGKTPADAAGITIGTALLLGALAASVQSNGIVNPAVALGLGSFSPMYLLGPLVGAVAAAWGYKLLVKR